MPYLLIALTIAFRLIPHPFNLVPIGALGLFAGAYCSPKFAWIVPLLALAIGDVLNGGYNPVVFLFVYLGFLGGPLIGRLVLARKRNLRRFVTATFAAASIFFVLSNLGIWLAGMYPPTVSGFIECYIMAIPYFGNTLAGDYLYGALLFGGAEIATRYMRGRSPETID
jgi:hypothetical protein